MTQKSNSFILPTLGLDFPRISRGGFKTTYLGDARISSWKEKLGKQLLLKFEDPSISTINYLESQETFVERYSLDDTNEIFVFTIPTKWTDGVVSPFLEGKYSEIDRDYVKAYFPKTINKLNGVEPSVNYMILNKDKTLKTYWESLIDTELDEDAEVWPIPELEDEILFYKEVEGTKIEA